MNLADFDQLYADHGDDPWGYRTRFYEQRKRDIVVASLPRAHYTSILECAASNGELAAALAPRCDQLLACDAAELAVRAARERLAQFAHARVEQRVLPDQWPEGSFDCIVVSELGYYLSDRALGALYRRAIGALTRRGTLILCHWLHPIQGCPRRGAAVHAAFVPPCSWTQVAAHREADFALEVWSRDSISVAAREGLV